jgi:predicted small lipoprotein YifL
MKKFILGVLFTALALIALAACGQKGNLYLPEPQPKSNTSPVK